ncbi:PulJ/GspJ family protein [Glaciecola petra]|uniref:Prepilin-type N-terminal cleavage/methylation domain-containing protein n=1 Tax=Glaciecola petra TaxID=3075602 RepID=A0ABU2ZTQ9_9ALTE|nr:prepilin-type N-terminal cleavage/methylation domain-containing protein [Aestuariibacter sp. P117]MDT0595646.1 prepilin-type N-terminal cleavage/methylation domain-containing protein [Aestuariibacter sp. P117]
MASLPIILPVQEQAVPVQKQTGFTLIELITVIVVLGIVSVSISGIFRSVVESVTVTNERENLVREGSFLMERLTRELSNAVPNSVRISGNSSVHCIEFVPLKWNAIYLQLPLENEVSTIADVAELSDIQSNVFVPTTSDIAVVFPTQHQDVYDPSRSKQQAVVSCTDDGDGDCSTLDDSDSVIQVSFDDGFATTSPSRRMYFADSTTSFCMRNNSVYRHQDSINVTQTLYTSGGTLMAQNIVNQLGASASVGEQNPFNSVPASFQRNAATSAFFIFGREEERVTFMKEVQIPNVP